MITKVKVVNLNNKISGEFNFHPDLNILSGKNGSGKTTLLKLMWYIMSGNIERVFEEMTLDYVKIDFADGDYFELTITGKDGLKKLKLNAKGDHPEYENEVPISQLEDIDSLFPESYGSLFFPTFRRIEGGFSTTVNSTSPRFRARKNILKDALDNISHTLSIKSGEHEHKFISSISTDDIDFLLSAKYSDISEEVRKLEDVQSKTILSVVANSQDREKESLEEIRNIVKVTDTKKGEMFKPLSVLSSFIDKIFKDKSIKIINNLKLGVAKEAITSEKLSAGEKQMLSFLCYNFFVDKSVIFIDEPELSLHTDWQRILFPTLLKQGKNNQFIIATHSPFIYSKYPEKEIIVDEDRGHNIEAELLYEE